MGKKRIHTKKDNNSQTRLCPWESSLTQGYYRLRKLKPWKKKRKIMLQKLWWLATISKTTTTRFSKRLWLCWITMITARFKINTQRGCFYITVSLKETDCLRCHFHFILHAMPLRNYTSFSLDPTLKWSEMTEHLRRDDNNPSEDLRGSQPSAIIRN